MLADWGIEPRGWGETTRAFWCAASRFQGFTVAIALTWVASELARRLQTQLGEPTTGRRTVALLSNMASYLPVYCAACARASLSTASPSAQQVCSFCEGPARVVPGPAFGDGDWLAFSEIDDAVFEAALNRDEVAALTEELQQLLARADSHRPAVDLMIQRIPSLGRCRPALVNGPTRGARLLMTLLSARSRDLPITAEVYRTAAQHSSSAEGE